MSVGQNAAKPEQKKLLALDGGGILGLISLGYLVEMERMLREKLKKGPEFRLAHYFDYIAGNSTGSIIAAGLALGMSALEVRDLYLHHGEEMFDKNWFISAKTYSKYQGAGLTELLKQKFGATTTLGAFTGSRDPQAPRPYLMVVMRNARTDSPWPVSSNPEAKYNDRKRADCNLDLPLWKLVRASTAAPTYFPAETITLGSTDFVFVDGGITMFNNPAFQLFLMATVDCYKLSWATGEDKMLLVSVGTGSSPDADPRIRAQDLNLLYNASHIPGALMAAANAQQDFLCRVFGKCLFGEVIDREIGDMIGDKGKGPVSPKLFTYVRYNTDLTQPGLDKLGLNTIKSADVQAIDAVDPDSLHRFDLVGKVGASRSVKWDHFENFPA